MRSAANISIKKRKQTGWGRGQGQAKHIDKITIKYEYKTEIAHKNERNLTAVQGGMAWYGWVYKEAGSVEGACG